MRNSSRLIRLAVDTFPRALLALTSASQSEDSDWWSPWLAFLLSYFYHSTAVFPLKWRQANRNGDSYNLFTTSYWNISALDTWIFNGVLSLFKAFHTCISNQFIMKRTFYLCSFFLVLNGFFFERGNRLWHFVSACKCRCERPMEPWRNPSERRSKPRPTPNIWPYSIYCIKGVRRDNNIQFS